MVKDTPAHLLPPEAWSDSRNMRFRDGVAVKFTGHSNVFGAPSIAPHWAMPVTDPNNAFWMYSNLTKMHATDGTTHTDITRTVGGDYAATNDRLWNGGILGGIAVITDGVTVPQYWATASLGTPLAALPNWPATALCRVIRPFKNFLIALNITKSGTMYPHMVKWSHPADPGTIPISWDETDPTKDAGERNLEDSQYGSIVGGLSLRDLFMIYKERSVWAAQLIGGQFIFRYLQMFESIGLLNEKCVTAYGKGGAKHFLATGDDILVHNGQEPQSILEKRWHKFLNANINSNRFRRCYVIENPAEHEVWFCFPEVGADWPTLAMVWNSVENTIAVRELNGGIPHIALGPIPGANAGGIWDADTNTWDSDTSLWDEQTFFGQKARLLQSNRNVSKLQLLDDTELFDGLAPTAYLERQALAVIGQDRQGNPKMDFTQRRLVKRIWPKITGGPVNIRLGMQEQLNGPITWYGPKTFNPNTQKYLDFTANGRLPAIRFETNGSESWELHGYDLEIKPLGQI